MARVGHLAVVTLSVALVAGCVAGPGPSGPPASTASEVPTAAGPTTAGPLPVVSLTILGAASLQDVLGEAKGTWEAASPGSHITVSTDSSATLEAQIELGSPADILLSADTTNPQKLVEKGLTSGAPVAFATNNLTLVVPLANPAAIRTAFDLARSGVRVIAAGDAVPITKYASQVVAKLATLPNAPAGFTAAYAANVRSKEDNVRAVVAKIELGEGDAAIVYVTDAAGPARVTTIALPEAANVPASYAGVVVKASHDPGGARAFLDWFAGPGGQAILARHGFLPPA